MMKKAISILGLLHFYLVSSQEIPRYVTGSILGGLGNQLFEIATACAVAWDNDAEAYFPELEAILKHSSTAQHVLHRCLFHPPINETSIDFSTGCYGYNPIHFVNGMRISGYSQNEKYFLHHKERISNLFSPTSSDMKYIRRKYGKLLKEPKSIAVHIRYYYQEKPEEASFFQYDEEYYEKAMSLFDSDALFVVFSDNMEFAKKIIRPNGRKVKFIQNEPCHIDFYLQSLCKHNIIANSTYSWWAAWLNKNPYKVVVRPARWIGGYPDIGGPDEWIKIEASTHQEKNESS